VIAYVSYDGALEPLGRSQVVPYVVGLAAAGLPLTLLSFEKPHDYGTRREPSGAARTLAAELTAARVRWRPLRYHKRPTLPATLWDVATGVAMLLRLRLTGGLRVVHARGYVAGLMAWLLKKTTGTKFVFDMRGFWPEERVDGGLWRAGSRIYRVVKILERRFLRDADRIVVLTDRARLELRRRGVRPPVTVVPTCVDLERFRPAAQAPAAPTLVYAGSLGTVYPLAAMLAFVRRVRAREPRARLLLVSRADRQFVSHALAAAGLDGSGVTVDAADHGRMPAVLAGASVGLAFYRPGPSRQATCPTKVGEYLACGLPVVVTAGVGDMDALIAEHRTGVVIDAFTDAAYERALDELEKLLLEPDLAARCRALAERHFSLRAGVERFVALHRALEGSPA
jgi:glycosyltransferase involved in cell wall biosynthesis